MSNSKRNTTNSQEDNTFTVIFFIILITFMIGSTWYGAEKATGYNSSNSDAHVQISTSFVGR